MPAVAAIRESMRKIYVTGMNSGQNPSSGLGIHRCLRTAFPKAHLVGVDHWQGSSGLHADLIDEVLLLPQWKQVDAPLLKKQLMEILEAGHLWIGAMDMEVYWIAKNLGTHPSLLVPDGNALERTAKPSVEAFRGMDFRVPEYIQADIPDDDIHAFLRHHSWQCWMKSPYHDAKRITSWGVFERTREHLKTNWKTSKLFIQRHGAGTEEPIARAAYQGKSLGAAHLQKRQLTPEGKTWAGHVSPLPPEEAQQLAEIIRDLNWTGGGELEYVRDSDGNRWIIECNPRFPAWIYGAAMAGLNLPGRVVSNAWGEPFPEVLKKQHFFTRVVYEIAAKEAVGVPLPAAPTTSVWSADGKLGKGGPSFSDYLPDVEEDDEDGALAPVPLDIPPAMLAEVRRIAHSFNGETPARIHLEDWTLARFRSLADRVASLRSGTPQVRIGYSVKTCPTDMHLRKAKECGFFAECISQMEVKRALDFGFRPDQVILNGPGKFWPITNDPVLGLHQLFCDSVEEFERVSKTPGMAKTLGFRLRLPKLHSRFGTPISDFEVFQRMMRAIRQSKAKSALGFHFHMPSWSIGVERWIDGLQSLLLWCRGIERLTDKPIEALDLGGGFFPEDLHRMDLKSVQALIHSALPNVKALYFEPGRSLTQDGEVLVSRVLDVRKQPGKDELEAVVDACIAELPLAQSFPHRLYFRPRQATNAGCVPLTKGSARILGRICMEDDILAQQVELPEDIQIGDFVIFGDAGGYERSMSYDFGRG